MKKQKTPASNSKIFARSLKTKKVMRPWMWAVFAVFFVLVGTYAVMRTMASTFQLYINPETTIVNLGDSVTVSVRTDPGTDTDGVDVTLNYDPAVLEYVSLDTSTSGYPVTLASPIAPGQVRIIRGIFSPGVVNTDSLIANINFKTIANASSSKLTMSGKATWRGADVPLTLGSATVTVGTPTPPPPPPPPPTPTPPPSPPPTPNPTPTPTPPPPPPPADTTAPIVTITSPASGSTPVKSKFAVKATATDDTKVTKMEVYADNSILNTTIGSSVNYNWTVKSKRIAKGSHTITVKAYDAAGNVGMASVTVTK